MHPIHWKRGKRFQISTLQASRSNLAEQAEFIRKATGNSETSGETTFDRKHFRLCLLDSKKPIQVTILASHDFVSLVESQTSVHMKQYLIGMSWNILEHPTQSKSGMTVRCFVFDSWHKLQTYPYHSGPRVWENIYRFSRATPLARMAYDAPIGMHCLEHAVVEHSCIVCSTNLLSILVAHQHIVICQVKFQYPGLDVVAGNVVTPKQVGTERML